MRIENHIHGSMSWAVLFTTDQKASELFYSNIFGWNYHDDYILISKDMISQYGEPSAYSLALKNQSYVSGIAPLKDKNIHPHWNVYFTVRDIYSILDVVPSLGGSIITEPSDSHEIGILSVIEDPTGARLTLCQTSNLTSTGLKAGRKHEPGYLEWSELLTLDKKVATEFYSTIFGVDYEISEDNDDYIVMSKNDIPVFGIMTMPEHLQEIHCPAHWCVYFNVSNLDDTIEQAKANGAQLVVEPIDIKNVARFAVLVDPQGADFGVMHPAYLSFAPHQF